MRAVLYVRNSSGKQVAAGTHEGLLSSGRETAARLGADVVAVYADKGISAKSGNLDARGDFARLVAELPTVRPDICIVANVDRLTRTELFRELGAIWGPLQEARVRVATAGGQVIDLGTPDGQLMAMFESWRSARENAARSERSRTGRRRAAREGRNPGRPPYGYSHQNGRWQAPNASVVLEVYERVISESAAAIAGLLNARGLLTAWNRPWTAGGVADMVRPRHPNGDPYVTGLWFGQKGEPAIKVPAIVPAELAAKARAALASRSLSPPPSTRFVQFLDERGARCGICGGWIRVAQSRGRRRADGSRTRFAYYGCQNRVKSTETGAEACSLPLRRVEAVDAAVWRSVLAWAEGGKVVNGAAGASSEGRAQAQQDLETARRQLGAEGARLEALAEALGAGAISADSYRAQVARVSARRDLLARQVATWETATAVPEPPDARARAALRQEIAEASLAADVQLRRALVRRLFPAWWMDGKGVSAMLRSGSALSEANTSPERIAVVC